MTLYLRCETLIPHDTGLPEDAVVNTWAFSADDSVTLGGACIAWNNALDTFYSGLGNYFSSMYDLTQVTNTFINMADVRPRVPIAVLSPTITGSISTDRDFPPEVALCLSFKGDTVSGENPRRRRGRVYLGPFQYAAVDSATPSSGIVDQIATAGDTLKDTALVDWCVYSRYTHYGVPVGRNIDERDDQDERVFDEVPDFLPASFVPVTTVWCDNAWDTQRRRGTKATYRKTIT